ncbi:hypothetical protein AVEN_25540-1 [Araneus ventricosus]|uniref:Uncharacterized protein n=1 Tax=Araneus ventricosus TaxID=182803 RepID=A0A4Y2T4A2_ARAVE|nr:hypothetical protein AVEN_25540-1 [Araneus ventricosus]
MAEGHPSNEISMESDADKAKQFSMYQAEMRDHIRTLSVLRIQFGIRPTSAEVRNLMDDSAKELKRITGERHDLSLHLTGIDNDVFTELINEVNDILRYHGYGSSDDGSDTDSNYSECSVKNIDKIINADLLMRNSNDFKNRDKSTNDKKKCKNNYDMHKSMTSLENDYDGVNSNMDIDKVNVNDNGTCAKQNYDLSIKHNVFNGTGDIPNSGIDKNYVMHNLSVKINNIPRNGNNFVYTVPQRDLHDSRVVNNCVAYNVPSEEITADDVDSQIMNVDPTDSANLNVNNGLIDNDNFQFQGRRRKRVPSNETVPCKKIVTDSGLSLQNSYDVLAKLPAEDNPPNQTNKAGMRLEKTQKS